MAGESRNPRRKICPVIYRKTLTVRSEIQPRSSRWQRPAINCLSQGTVWAALYFKQIALLANNKATVYWQEKPLQTLWAVPISTMERSGVHYSGIKERTHRSEPVKTVSFNSLSHVWNGSTAVVFSSSHKTCNWAKCPGSEDNQKMYVSPKGALRAVLPPSRTTFVQTLPACVKECKDALWQGL